MAQQLDFLDAHQQELLDQFQTITQSEDLDTALDVLTQHDWQLERALQSFYDTSARAEASTSSSSKPTSSATPPPRPPLESAAPRVTSSSPSSTNATSRATAPAARRSGLLSLFMWPFGLAWNITWSLLSMLNKLLPARRLTQRPPPVRSDPRSAANRFLRDFEKDYGETHVLFYPEGYSHALEKARHDLQFLLVILQSDEHDDTDAFCRQVLTNEELMSYIQAKNILVWAGNVNHVEGYQVSCTLQASTYPFMAVIALQTVGSSQKMTVVDRIEGVLTPEPLIQRLDAMIQRHGSVLSRLRLERDQRELERQLRQDQDRAYRESLLADQEKERRAEEQRQKELQQQEKERLAEEERQRKLEKRAQYIQSLCTILANEPGADYKGKITKINFRLANGERVVRAFKEEDTVETLYQFVEAYPLLAQHPESVAAPAEYQHVFRFNLHSPFPRTIYDVKEQRTVPLSDIPSLWPSATLIVDDDAGEEEE
ncbi:thioredoxin-like protein [Gongronella butleri]|nr:thioredoxin-like protein [Gongronella butleri]